MANQTASIQKGDPRALAIPAGVRKMPTAITSPTTAAVAEPSPSCLLSSTVIFGKASYGGQMSHQRCDLKKPRAKPWVDNRRRTATPQRGNVGPMGRDRLLAIIPRASPWAILGRAVGATTSVAALHIRTRSAPQTGMPAAHPSQRLHLQSRPLSQSSTSSESLEMRCR